MTQGGSSWYSLGSASYYASSADRYNGTLYRKDWNANDGYYYTAVSGPFYRNYSKSKLMFSNESDAGVTLYDSTTITASATVKQSEPKSITILGRKK